ncbi:glycerophosphodiester phosphodiesterase [Oceanobacillus piezotolerans]|uniref:Glycerophosphodiester phosphodiesterase n=1 Tax=Oceanobacillus piezotolerans TaxID=2448030 RepID=A0A498DMW0_9BACI|nr:glycerophosphodiester phosphodiesterase [Oceanobacillus piezotolerans]RLL45092.1 glycerophosphodiester phosphodiesterase [Oceanobacillus piezotolerans]
MRETKIYGHRGSMGAYPENTLISFQKAIEQGVDGIELDVHMTKDGEIVVIHDEQLDRTTDGNGFIKDLTLPEIKEYSAGAKFQHFESYDYETWGEERVPTLQEVLELLHDFPKVELNIELKTYIFPYFGIEEKVLSLVEQYGNNRKVVYSSFHLPSLLRIKNMDPTAKIAWLLMQGISHPVDYMETFAMESLHISKDMVLENVYDYKNLLQNLRVWTANSTDEIKQLLDLQVQAIITDYPEKALFFRNERKMFV